ncbi:hypothetical protein SYK_06680 [Pseudodesulfovibrio nedwellii]|uniref:Uncharacterized protein n=1 Tax=Pseudodesulfovibrio nedwellii TaxID=2973072 RepID=A0ABM8AXU6_9BACT|nr:hypothetical protein [Pseudodesulfovibrio nedwellii]BDQ36308.1 hypothetical protein SYK_06680 [Pseudodesulfovibrio nedwellii]
MIFSDNDLRALKNSWDTPAVKLVRSYIEDRINQKREQLETELDTKEMFRLQGRITELKEALEDMAPDGFKAQKPGGYTA